jgi:hypothetical protein
MTSWRKRKNVFDQAILRKRRSLREKIGTAPIYRNSNIGTPKKSSGDLTGTSVPKKGSSVQSGKDGVCYLSREKAGLSLRALSKYFGVDDSAVSQGARRLAYLQSKDRKLNQLLLLDS